MPHDNIRSLGMGEMLHKYPTRHPETGIERIDGKLMAASPDDHLHVFVNEDDSRNEVAERIVELASGRRTVKQIAQVLCDEFDVALPRAEQDAEHFVSQLVEAKVLIVQDGPLASPE
jgi:hypothetical protein